MRTPAPVALMMLAAAGLLLTGCGRRESAAEKRTLVYGTTERAVDLDPAQAYDFHTLEILQNIHRGLMTYEPGTARLVPDLAESYAANERGDEFTFKLRKNLEFGDGTALNAQAVKWAIDRVARLQGDSAWLVTDFVRRVEAVDRRTVRFTLKEPAAFFPALAASVPYFPVSPSSYPADRIVRDPGELAGVRLAGLGPYRIVSLGRDEVVLEANPRYRGPRPGVGRIVIRTFADAAAVRLALEEGRIDLAFRTLGLPDIRDLRAGARPVAHRFRGPQIRYLCFETSRSVFRDRTLRQAVAALVDRREIVDGVAFGLNTPLYSMVPEGIAFHHPSFGEAYGERPDVARADALLASAGYTAETPLRFDLWHAADRYGAGEAAAAAMLEAQLERSRAIRVEVRSADWVTYWDQGARGEMPAWLLGWYPDYLDADDYTAPFAAAAGSRSLGLGFSDAEWDRWFAVERGSVDPAVRGGVFERIQKAWTEEVPTLPLWQSDLHLFARPGVTDLKVGLPLSLDYASLRLE